MLKYHFYKMLRMFHLISKKKFKKKFPSEYKIITKSKLFDKKWYLKHNPAVKTSKIDPVIHYLQYGWKEGRNPSASFDGNEYLKQYPDVKSANICPLIHYELFGKKENRCYKYLKNKPFVETPSVFFDKFICKYKNKFPKVSIIVASYNYQNYIKETLDGLIKQTYKNFEIIVVDDGSKDNSNKIIKEYADNYDFIKLYHHKNNENRGLPETIKLGIEKAMGEYIAFCESDDYWVENYLEEKIKIINKYANPVIISNDVYAFGNYKRCQQLEKNVLNDLRSIFNTTKNKLSYKDFKKKNYIPTLSCCMIKTKELLKCNLLDNPRPSATDWWIYRQLVAKKYPIYYIPQKLTFWRMHNSYNTTQFFNFRLLQSLFDEMSDKLCHQKAVFNKNADAEIIEQSLYFDSKWYTQQYNININPTLHYLYIGWKEGFNPSLKFDNNLYLSFYDDVRRAQINPLLHYEKFGKQKRLVVSSKRNILDVLIITPVSKTDGVYIWRVNFIKELLEREGLIVKDESLCNLSPNFLNNLYDAKLVIFNRPLNRGISAQIIKELNKLNKKWIIDIDDLLIGEFAAYSGRYKSNNISFSDTLDAVLSQSECFYHCENISVSTNLIAREIKKKFDVGTIHLPNVISASLLSPKHKDTTEGLKLLYASGTKTHDFDVSTIYIDLFNIMLKHKDITLTILGESSISECFRLFEDRICVIPYSNFEGMLSIYAQHDLLLVPLEDNLFNNAKSNIKYIEAGAVGTPVLARDVDEFKSIIKDGINGFLYNDNFYEKFEQIYQKYEELYLIGQNAYIDVLENHSTNVQLSKEIKEILC